MNSDYKREIWRGYTLGYWYREAATVPGLRRIIDMYSTSETPIGTRRGELILQTIHVLDNYQPQLTDEEAHAAIRFQRGPVPSAQPQIGEQAVGGVFESCVEPIFPADRGTEASDAYGQRANGETSSSIGRTMSGPNIRSEETEEAPILQHIDTTKAQSAKTPDISAKNNVEARHDSNSGAPELLADAASLTSLADHGLHHIPSARPSNHVTNPNAKQSRKESSTVIINDDSFTSNEAFSIISQLSTLPGATIDDLRRTLRRYLLQATSDRLQPSVGCDFLLPIQNPAAGKTIISRQAFDFLLDDNHDPGIRSVQVEFTQGKIPHTHDYQCSRVGYALPYRGCGPIWLENSCHVDCCIVAARLMSVGQVQADSSKTSGPDERENPIIFQNIFRNFLALPWEKYTRETNIKRRHDFLRNYYIRRAELGKGGRMGSMHAANDSWQVCAEGFGQFQYTVYKQTTCDTCSKISPLPTNLTETGVLEFDAPTLGYWKFTKRNDIIELFRKHFSPKPFRSCSNAGCEGQTSRTRIIDGELPQRLVLPTPTIPPTKAGRSPILKDRDIVGATSNLITVPYRSTAGQKTAHYRWLGGIYEFNKHYRLYWSDRSNGDGDNLMVYDGMRLNGSIIGGVPPYHPYNAVPPPWSQGCDVLFYERVYPEIAQVKANAIRTMMDDILEQEHMSGSKRRYSETSEKVTEESGPRKRGSGSPASRSK